MRSVHARSEWRFVLHDWRLQSHIPQIIAYMSAMTRNRHNACLFMCENAAAVSSTGSSAAFGVRRLFYIKTLNWFMKINRIFFLLLLPEKLSSFWGLLIWKTWNSWWYFLGYSLRFVLFFTFTVRIELKLLWQTQKTNFVCFSRRQKDILNMRFSCCNLPYLTVLAPPIVWKTTFLLVSTLKLLK